MMPTGETQWIGKEKVAPEVSYECEEWRHGTIEGRRKPVEVVCTDNAMIVGGRMGSGVCVDLISGW